MFVLPLAGVMVSRTADAARCPLAWATGLAPEHPAANRARIPRKAVITSR
jgi:hypothetical protein